MREEIKVKLKRELDQSYPITIGMGIFPGLALELKQNPLGESYAIITDANVAELYGKRFCQLLKAQGLKVFVLSFVPGERSKNPKVWLKLMNEMLKLGLGRDSCVIALGGGVVGDLAGFVAASYLRGINWIQVPTTLLAMVDASIGGKVGIDLPLGKNLLGAFWQPKAVYLDLNCLRTLPKRHLLNGMAEVLKAGLISDAELFSLLLQNGKEVLKLKPKLLREMILRSLRVKARVVEQDEREILGLRKILNYGHTIGHSLEALSGYQMLHGIAVSLGMRAAARISVEMGFLKEKEAQQQNRVLEALGFPKKIPARLAKILKTKKGKAHFWEHLYQDKKVRAGKVEMVLLSGIGRVARLKGSWTVPVSEELIELGLEEILL